MSELRLEPGSLEASGAFVRAAGLELDEVSGTRVTGHIDLSEEMVAVGLTNTTHFLRSVTAGRVLVEAEAVHQGRSQQLWRVDIRDERARLLAHGEVRLQNLDPGAG
jgi:1,4-dihydroxy-2-naphthoyl-CoA hydrolase